MEKINVHMTRDEYMDARLGLLGLYNDEDNDAKAEIIFKIYKSISDWDFAEETEEDAR